MIRPRNTLPPGSPDNARRAARLAKMDRMLGTPFQQLPGKPPQHQVVRELPGPDGVTLQKIRVSDVEMVMNDAWMIDYCDGAGAYGRSYSDGSFMSRVYELAVELYGCQPIDLHGGKVGPYQGTVVQ